MRWYKTAKLYCEHDPAARYVLEVILTYPGYHALGFYRVAHALHQCHLKLLARIVSNVGRFFTNIEIHPAATLGNHILIDHGAGVVIGETATLGDYCHIYHGVTLGGKSSLKEKRHPQLDSHVTVGAGAILLGNINIGSHATIGAGSIVLKDVPANDIVAGNPAKSIKKDGSK